MQILFRAFLAIYLAHLLTDFVFQTEQKRRGKLLAYFFHGLTHYLSAVILVSFFLAGSGLWLRSEEHTSELQSHSDLVCRLLLEKKKRQIIHTSLNESAYSSLCILIGDH